MGSGDMEERAPFRVQFRPDQRRQGGDVARGAEDVSKPKRPGRPGRSVADRVDGLVAVGLAAGESADSVGAGDQQRLDPVQVQCRPFQVGDRNKRFKDGLDAAFAEKHH